MISSINHRPTGFLDLSVEIHGQIAEHLMQSAPAAKKSNHDIPENRDYYAKQAACGQFQTVSNLRLTSHYLLDISDKAVNLSPDVQRAVSANAIKKLGFKYLHLHGEIPFRQEIIPVIQRFSCMEISGRSGTGLVRKQLNICFEEMAKCTHIVQLNIDIDSTRFYELLGDTQHPVNDTLNGLLAVIHNNPDLKKISLKATNCGLNDADTDGIIEKLTQFKDVNFSLNLSNNDISSEKTMAINAILER
jgi:hypothetical protein